MGQMEPSTAETEGNTPYPTSTSPFRGGGKSERGRSRPSPSTEGPPPLMTTRALISAPSAAA